MAAPAYGTLQVRGGIKYQASWATAVYRIDVLNQMAAPTSGTIDAVTDLSSNQPVETDVMPSGSVSIESTTFVKLKALTALEPGHAYLIRFSFTDGTNTLGGVMEVRCPL